MTRRDLLTSAAALGAAACTSNLEDPALQPETARTHDWRLRYAPRMHLLGNDVPVEQQLDVYASFGFKAFEYNGLPREQSLEQAGVLRGRMDELGMEMGVFVVNSGGWKGDALVDAKFHKGFLADVRTALDYHKVMRNKWATVTSGLSVDYLSLERQTQNVIAGLKKAAEIVEGSELTLVLEPLNVLVDHAGYHVVTSEHAARIVDAVGSRRVKILFDIYHQQISEGNLTNNMDKYWDRIAYLQVGDAPGRKEPGTGEIRYRHLFQHVYEKGYQGILGMEHGLSQPGREGLEECFEQYRRADTWA
jgi:hydroxypyruvate isomerase